MTTSTHKKYIRRPDRPVTAVQLKLDSATLVYQKWGGEQRAKAGDWLVDNDGDVYTVSAATFDRTYRQTGPGTYVKTTPIWAERATTSGSMKTSEGSTDYDAGDYLVSNNEDGSDAYAISAEKFDSLYVLADGQ
jgi:hypothetical protein